GQPDGMGTRRTASVLTRMVERSPDGAKRNPGGAEQRTVAPHSASLHAGYTETAGGIAAPVEP
ncbi:MAG: hypothetical protein AB7U38_15370, partial [Hyphomicrobiales bacterium]